MKTFILTSLLAVTAVAASQPAAAFAATFTSPPLAAIQTSPPHGFSPNMAPQHHGPVQKEHIWEDHWKPPALANGNLDGEMGTRVYFGRLGH